MTREIRIPIDDDEIFERMKRRKSDLDLTWEDVLHRGLWGDADLSGERARSPPGPGADPADDLGDRLERQIKHRVEQSLMGTFGGEEAGWHPAEKSSRSYQAEMETLENAEDAVLDFPFLDDEPAYRVPLRVAIEMQAGGVDVEVVALRQGKSVSEMNSFDRAARKQIATALSTGSAVWLTLESGVEEYRVAPVVSWSQTDDGDPTVAEVEIDQVIFDDE